MLNTSIVQPYKNSQETKKEQVSTMFNNIAHRYDFLNHFLSFNIDKIWRRKAINLLIDLKPQQILDVASGTGDFAIETAKKLHPKEIKGIDISEGMLGVGRKKIKKQNLDSVIHLQTGDCEDIQFKDNSFDAVTVAFGVRNFEHLDIGLSEMNRVTKLKGKVVVLEFSKPQTFPIKQLYKFYSFAILPIFGKLFSKDNSAYIYLPESVQAFPDGQSFVNRLEKAGFTNCSIKKVAFGIATIYSGIKEK